jgi:hypothetical protein
MLRDASSPGPDWLTRLSPDAWIRQGLSELSRAERLLQAHDRAGSVLSLRRAAGMALNGALCVSFRDWGRTYVDHVRAVVTDETVPSSVRQAAQLLITVPLEREPNVVRLTPPSEGERWLEATKTIMAHAYAIVHGRAGQSS